MDIPRGIYNEKIYAGSLDVNDPNMWVDQVPLGRCRLTVSKPELKALLVSAISARN